MKIKREILEKFLDKVCLSDAEVIVEARFNFTEAGLHTVAMDAASIVKVDGMLKASAFIEYEAIGEIGVQNIPEHVKILKRFSDETEVLVDGNLLTIKGDNKKVETELVDVQFIEAKTATGDLGWDEQIPCTGKRLKEFLDDVIMNSEFEIALTTNDKFFSLHNTGKFKFTHKLDVPEAKGGVLVKVGEAFVSSTKKLTGNLMFHLKSDFPIKVVEETEHSTISVILAPRIDSEE